MSKFCATVFIGAERVYRTHTNRCSRRLGLLHQQKWVYLKILQVTYSFGLQLAYKKEIENRFRTVSMRSLNSIKISSHFRRSLELQFRPCFTLPCSWNSIKRKILWWKLRWDHNWPNKKKEIDNRMTFVPLRPFWSWIRFADFGLFTCGSAGRS